VQEYEKIIRKLIRESINLLFEVGDGFSFAEKEYMSYDEDAMPFFYYMDKLYIGKLRETHWDLIDNQLSGRIGVLAKKIEDKYGVINYDSLNIKEVIWETARNDIMTGTKYNGRIWLNSKLIAFWRLPDEKKFLDLIEELNSKVPNLNIDGSWKIFTQDENGDDNMIPLKDFTHGKLSPEAEKVNQEKWKQHMISPLEKEKRGLKVTPQGWGSTHPDYAGHRTIDRVLGRAE